MVLSTYAVKRGRGGKGGIESLKVLYMVEDCELELRREGFEGSGCRLCRGSHDEGPCVEVEWLKG